MSKIIRFELYSKRDGHKAPANVTDGGTARPSMHCHEGMLEFRDVRERIRREAASISPFFRPPPIPEPGDLDLRIARASYALYLLDTLDRMLHAVDMRGGKSLIASFESARKAAAGFLRDPYFEKSAEQIISSYGLMEGPLCSCASRCGISLLLPEPAVEAFKMRLDEIIQDINRRVPGGG